MTAYRPRITREAYDDMQKIFDFIEKDSPQNAANVIDRLLKSFESLTVLPTRYKIYRRPTKTREAVHAMPVPPYVVYYRVVESAKIVRILMVRHGARRRPQHFD